MELSEKELKECYKNKETDELILLHKDGGLIDIAMKTLKEELRERGVIIEDAIKNIEKCERDTLKASAPKTIKNSTTAFFVLAGLQILTSIGFKSYIGVIFGIFTVILAFGLRTKKSQGLAFAFIFIGVITFILNIIGPVISKMAWGNPVFSLIFIWLGNRCKKATKILEYGT